MVPEQLAPQETGFERVSPRVSSPEWVSRTDLARLLTRELPWLFGRSRDPSCARLYKEALNGAFCERDCMLERDIPLDVSAAYHGGGAPVSGFGSLEPREDTVARDTGGPRRDRRRQSCNQECSAHMRDVFFVW